MSLCEISGMILWSKMRLSKICANVCARCQVSVWREKITSFLPSFSFSPVYQDEKAKHILFVFPPPLSYFLMLVVWLNLALERCASAYLVHLGHTNWLACSLGLGDRAQFVVSQLKGHVNSLLSLSGTCWPIHKKNWCWIREITCFTGTGRRHSLWCLGRKVTLICCFHCQELIGRLKNQTSAESGKSHVTMFGDIHLMLITSSVSAFFEHFYYFY